MTPRFCVDEGWKVKPVRRGVLRAWRGGRKNRTRGRRQDGTRRLKVRAIDDFTANQVSTVWPLGHMCRRACLARQLNSTAALPERLRMGGLDGLVEQARSAFTQHGGAIFFSKEDFVGTDTASGVFHPTRACAAMCRCVQDPASGGRSVGPLRGRVAWYARRAARVVIVHCECCRCAGDREGAAAEGTRIRRAGQRPWLGTLCCGYTAHPGNPTSQLITQHWPTGRHCSARRLCGSGMRGRDTSTTPFGPDQRTRYLGPGRAPCTGVRSDTPCVQGGCEGPHEGRRGGPAWVDTGCVQEGGRLPPGRDPRS